jgi:competence protein ComEC
VVFADRKSTQLDFINGKQHSVYTGDLPSMTQIAGIYWMSRKLDIPDMLTNATWFACNAGTFGGKTFYVLSDDTFRKKKAEQPLQIDFLIVGNAVNITAGSVFESLLPQVVIVDMTISDWCAAQFSEICEKRNIPYYSVKESGAFIYDFKKMETVNFPLLP